MFYVLLKGAGQGCDYTIGCNRRWLKLNAENIDAARKETKDILDGYGESRVAKATILEVAGEESFDMSVWRADRAAARNTGKADKEKAERLAAYKKLKREFEGGVESPS